MKTAKEAREITNKQNSIECRIESAARRGESLIILPSWMLIEKVAKELLEAGYRVSPDFESSTIHIETIQISW